VEGAHLPSGQMAILYAAEDTYNSRSKAADLVYADNFLSSSGGTSWHYAGRATPGGPPAQPGTVSTDGSGLSPLDYLNKVSDLQLQLDAANRKLAQLQWPLFAVWWDAVSDLNTSDPTRHAAYKAQVILLRGEIQALQTLISDPKTGLTTQINAIVYDRPMPRRLSTISQGHGNTSSSFLSAQGPDYLHCRYEFWVAV
jgi:hypothetical protein